MLDSLPPYTFQIVGGIIVLFVGVKLIKKILGGGGDHSTTMQGSCSCGWSGTMSKYRPTCPRCGTRL